MIRFALGLLPTLIAFSAIAIVATRLSKPSDELLLSLYRLPIITVLVPAGLAGATAQVIHLRHPRRMLDRRSGDFASPVFFGAATGFLTVLLASASLLWLDRWLSDAAIFAIAAIIATRLVMFAARPRPAGCCIACGYDVRASLELGRCPECGMALSG
jgi:hypothetical protein